MNNKLVAYFSASGVTKKVAIKLAESLSADLYEIIPKEIYMDNDLNWNDPNSRSSIEMQDLSLRPEIKDVNIELDNYDTIYIGFPIWWGKAPNVVKTFLDKFDIFNKRIIVFCTSGGSALAPSVDDLKRIYPNAFIESLENI